MSLNFIIHNNNEYNMIYGLNKNKVSKRESDSEARGKARRGTEAHKTGISKQREPIQTRADRALPTGFGQRMPTDPSDSPGAQ